jgi:hypothetical protein
VFEFAGRDIPLSVGVAGVLAQGEQDLAVALQQEQDVDDACVWHGKGFLAQWFAGGGAGETGLVRAEDAKDIVRRGYDAGCRE